MKFSIKNKFLFIATTLFVYGSSCKKNHGPVTNYNENGNYFELKIGNKKYDIIIPFGKTFDAVNFYSKSKQEINGVCNDVSQINLKFNDSTLSKIKIITTINEYFVGNGIFNICNTNPQLIDTANAVCHIILNENKIGGFITGEIKGKIAKPENISCSNCCVNLNEITGSFKLIVKD
jgi:hypothetical protein